MPENKLSLQPRSVTGKKLKSIRKAGLVPSVIYSGGKASILTQSPYNATEKAIRQAGYHSPLSLELDGKKKTALIKKITLDPVTRQIINVDFQAVSNREAVTATAPLKIVDFESSAAAKAGLALSQALESVEIKAKPSALPEELTLSAAELATLEDKLTLADLQLPEGVEFADKEIDLTQLVANLRDPAAEAAAAAAAEAAAKETEAAEAAEPAENSGESSDGADSSDESADQPAAETTE